MPRRRGETDQDWMARLHRERNRIMERTKAAVCYINTTRLGREDPTALVAFMDIFHPEVPADKVLDMARGLRHDRERGA